MIDLNFHIDAGWHLFIVIGLLHVAGMILAYLSEEEFGEVPLHLESEALDESLVKLIAWIMGFTEIVFIGLFVMFLLGVSFG